MTASRFALLKDLQTATSSEERRDLLRRVTGALSDSAQPGSEAEFRELDKLLSQVAREYAVQVRTEFAQLVASSVTRFCESAEQFAMDDIAVAEPVLRNAGGLSDDILIRVAREKSQAHKLAVTKRHNVSVAVSDALVEHGDDNVVASLLENATAQIAEHTYDKVMVRAEENPALQAPLIRRESVPLDLLHNLYQRVEAQLRGEIVAKFGSASPDDLERAFKRSRERVSNNYTSLPEDMPAARKRLRSLQMSGKLAPAILPTLLREGGPSRTVFGLALAQLTDVEFHIADRVQAARDLDTLALLCRGARFDKGIFTSLAIILSPSSEGLAGVEKFNELYDAVPVEAAQRAMRFWKLRAA